MTWAVILEGVKKQAKGLAAKVSFHASGTEGGGRWLLASIVHASACRCAAHIKLGNSTLIAFAHCVI